MNGRKREAELDERNLHLRWQKKHKLEAIATGLVSRFSGVGLHTVSSAKRYWHLQPRFHAGVYRGGVVSQSRLLEECPNDRSGV